MKKIIAVMTCAVLLLSLTSCTPGKSKNGEVKKITVWSMSAEDQDQTTTIPRLQKWAKDFNTKHKDINVVVEGGKKSDGILTAISAGATPDIFQNFWQYAPKYAANSCIMDLTKYVNKDTAWDKSDFLESTWGLCTYNNKIYSVPFTASTTYIVYNPTMLSQRGWSTFPKTMDDLLKCIKDCTVKNADGSVKVTGLNPIYPWEDDVLWPVAFGATWQNASSKPTFNNNDAMSKAYSFQKTLIDDQGGYKAVSAWVSNYGNSLATTSDPLLTGKCAMYFTPDSCLASLEDSAKKLNTTFKIATFPAMMLTSGVWEINAKTPDPDAAWTVLASLTSSDTMKTMAHGDKNLGTFMSRKSALKALQGYDVPTSVKDAATLLTTSKLEHFPMSAYVNDYLSSIGTHMGNYFQDKETLNNAMDAIQKEATEAAAKGK